MEKESIFGKHTFSEEEKKKIAQQLAQAVSDKGEADEELKAIKADFKSKIELADSQINGYARKLQSGFEMRSIECNVIRDYEAKTITYIAIDDGRTIDIRQMSQSDLQRPIIESERADAVIN